MKFYFIALFTLCCFSAGSQSNRAITEFQQVLEDASIGICVKDMAGKDIVSYNKNMALTPASVLKILTSATALEVLGEDYRFRTVLSVDKNDPYHLIVHGYGDPTLGSEFIKQPEFREVWLSHISKNISTDRPVQITVVDDYFGYAGVSSKWIQEDLGNYFAAGAYGISIFDNTYRLYFNTMRTDTCPVIQKTVPNMKDMVFLNTLQLNNTGKDNGYINGDIFSNYRKLVGDIPAKKTSFSIKGDIPDPGLMLGEILSKELTAEGYTVNRVKTIRSTYYQNMFSYNKAYPFEEVPFYTHLSPTLKEIVKVVNFRSNNHYTEHLIRAIGRINNQDIYKDALSEGIIFTKLFWKSKGIDSDAMFIYDGCGLAPSNKISAEVLCDILLYMQNKSKYSQAFISSMPKAGKEGTVRNILKGTRLENKVFVKSGSIANVQCFSGYYVGGDKKYTFAVMVNNYNSPRKQVVKAIEKLFLNIF